MILALERAIDHWRIRRNVWFNVYYKGVQVPPEQAREAWSSLMELDNVLNALQQIGLVPRFWQANPPISKTDNGGFDQKWLKGILRPEDLPLVEEFDDDGA
jgi:hypothetical protein